MTQVVRMERALRRLHQMWAAGAIILIAAATSLAVAAAGESAWVRLVLGAIAVERCWAACVHRASLAPAVVAATAALMIVPVDARLDRTTVAAAGAVAVVAAAECAHVSRRLVTVAPVTRTTRDVTSVATTAALGALAAAVTIALGITDGWATPALIIGLGISAGAFAWLVHAGFKSSSG